MTLRRLFGRNKRLKRAQRERAPEHLFGPVARRGGNILVFREHYGSFHGGEVLLAVGITEDEQAMCLESGSSVVLERLRGAGIFPFTEERETFTDEPA